MLRWHRLCAILALPLLLYIIFTGTGTELSDMTSLVSNAPETSANMRRMREHVYGAPNYAVISATDYASPALPAGLDYAGLLHETARLGRATVPGGTLRLVEVRGYEHRLAGHVRMDDKDLVFDLADGKPLPAAALPWPQPPGDLTAPRVEWKAWHRLGALGYLGATANALAGLAIATMMVTGLIQYSRLYKARARMKRHSPFWSGGSWWRVIHRSLSLVAVIPVVWLTVSGLALAIDNIVPGLRGVSMDKPEAGASKDAFFGDFSLPMSMAELPEMAGVTLSSFTKANPGTGIKVLRLRYFAGYPQGIIIAADHDTSQFVYNARTGSEMSMSEPGYPKLVFPSGWQMHQTLKRIHRGDFFGMPGRWLATFTGLALLYLIVSGVVMYFQLWQRRAKSGRTALIWK